MIYTCAFCEVPCQGFEALVRHLRAHTDEEVLAAHLATRRGERSTPQTDKPKSRRPPYELL